MKTIHDSEVLKEGQQVITACAFIHSKVNGVEKLFLPKRASTKKFLPGVFELPGGHIGFGEEIVHGLKREVKEEFGVDISVGDPYSAFTYINDIKKSHSIEVIYFAKLENSIEEITLNPEDHSEYLWISENEVDVILSSAKQQNDPEYLAIRKGFKVLRGENQNFG